MFERFTDRARQVVVYAQDEARALKHNYIGTEHLLLGLLREKEGVGARTLGLFGVTLDEVRGQVARIVGTGEEAAATGQVPFTPRAKKVLELSLTEAQALGHNYIGTEHILLGLARENSGVAARILLDLGLDDNVIRSRTIQLLGGSVTTDVMSKTVRRAPGLSGNWLPVITAGLFLAVGLAIGLLLGWAIWG
jgi:ATP-dependent Clp protease ATP-binding subunit ClpC